MGKSTHFFGQPVYGQLIKSLDRDEIVEMSRKNGGEKYVKSFDGYTHLVTMLFAVIMRFDSPLHRMFGGFAIRRIMSIRICNPKRVIHHAADSEIRRTLHETGKRV